jgi:hypothetical protein
MSDDVDVDSVLRLAVSADLPLSEQRATAVAELLSAWLPSAKRLSARMRAEDLRALSPAVAFTQGPADDEADRRTVE